jgi:hypothetical protein
LFVTVLFGDRHSSGMLRGPGSYVVTEISAQYIAPIFKGLAIHEEGERMPEVNRVENLKSLTQNSLIFNTFSASIHIAFKIVTQLIYWLIVCADVILFYT